MALGALSLSVVLLIGIGFGPTRFHLVQGADTKVFSEEDKKLFVRTLNRMRESVFPTAADMNFVTWSSKLEALAVKAAGRCDYEHTYGGEYAGLGENIYAGWRTDPVELTLVWYTEKAFYDHNRRACTAGKECGHYTQLIASAVKTVGCARKGDCPKGGPYTYCEYSFSSGGSIYKYGPPCSACPDDMPLCLNNLCISSTLANAAETKEIDSTASTSAAKCRLACKNCGLRDETPGNCKCNCGTEATGNFCETKKAGSTAKCTACTETPACLNSGVEDETDPLKCKCNCKSGHVGDRCEIVKDVHDNSVKLVISAASFFESNRVRVMPPASRSLFNSKLWTALQGELSKAINTFCQKDATNFVKCCSGKTFPGDAGVASKSHVKAGDLKFTESSIGNSLDGSLNLMVHSVVTDSALCNAGGASGRKKRAAATYVPRAVILSATKASISAISSKLTSCCDNTVLSDVKEFSDSSDTGSGGTGSSGTGSSGTGSSGTGSSGTGTSGTGSSGTGSGGTGSSGTGSSGTGSSGTGSSGTGSSGTGSSGTGSSGTGSSGTGSSGTGSSGTGSSGTGSSGTGSSGTGSSGTGSSGTGSSGTGSSVTGSSVNGSSSNFTSAKSSERLKATMELATTLVMTLALCLHMLGI